MLNFEKKNGLEVWWLGRFSAKFDVNSLEGF